MRQIFLLGASLGRHRLDCFEFVAADQIHAREHPFELLAQPRFDFALDPGKRAQRACRNPRQLVEEAVLALHRLTSPTPTLLAGLPPKYGAALARRESEQKEFLYRRGGWNAGMVSSTRPL